MQAWSAVLSSSAASGDPRIARGSRRRRRYSSAASRANRSNCNFGDLYGRRSCVVNAFDAIARVAAVSGRAVQFDRIGDEADDASAAGALELRVAGRGVFAGEHSAAQAMGFLNNPVAVMIAAQQET